MDNGEFYIDDLINLIKNKRELNFIGRIGIPLNAYGIYAFSNYVNKRNICLNGYLFAQKHIHTGRIVGEEKFLKELTGIVTVHFRNEYREKPSILRNLKDKLLALINANSKIDLKKRTIYAVDPRINASWFTVCQKALDKDFNLVYVIIDDGSGVYSNALINAISYTSLTHPEWSGGRLLLGYIGTLGRYIYHKIFRKLLIAHGRIVDFRMYKKTTVFEKNEIALAEYVSAFKKISSSVNKDIIAKFNGTVVINTQCEEGTNSVDEMECFAGIEEVTEVINGIGIKPIVKLHPREHKLEKYNGLEADVIKTDVSQEILLAGASMRPLCMISSCSSAMLNAHMLYDIPCISLAKIMLKRNISVSQKIGLKDYIKIYKDYYFFPEDMEEFIVILKRLITEKS